MYRGELRDADILVDNRLAGVFADGVIGDKNRRRLGADALAGLVGETVGLRVESLVVIRDAGQQSGAGNAAIEPGDFAVGQRSGIGWLAGLRALQGLIQRDQDRLRGRSGICLRGLHCGLRWGESD